jgi:hypothetical protein
VRYETIVERRARKAIARLPSTAYSRVMDAIEGLSPKTHAPGASGSCKIGRATGFVSGTIASSTGWTMRNAWSPSWRSGAGKETTAERRAAPTVETRRSDALARGICNDLKIWKGV